MSNHFDIDYLRKYVNGDLNSAEMYAVEKASHQDEQLMDVILGLEEEQRDAPPLDLRDLHIAIYERTHPKPRRFGFPYRVALMAASLLIALTVGTIWYSSDQSDQLDEPRSYAMDERFHKEIDTTLERTELSNKSEDFHQESPRVATTPGSKETNENVPSSLTNNQEQESENDPDRVIEQIVQNNPGVFLKRHGPLVKSDTGITERTSPNPRLTSAQQENHSSVIQIDRGRISREMNIPHNYEPVAFQSSDDVNQIATGVVLDLQSGRPIANATVRDVITNNVVTTDSTGQYIMPHTTDKQQLDVLSIGYQKTRVIASNNKIIHLKPDFQNLEEVVSMGPSSEVPRMSSTPLIGWAAYKKYINDKAAEESHEKGKVTLFFDVSSFGRPIDIQINESSNPDLNQKAVDLVRRGPDWKKGNDGELVKLQVDFK